MNRMHQVGLVGALALLSVVGFGDAQRAPCAAASGGGQIYCCNGLVTTNGNWIGASRTITCDDYMRDHEAERESICSQLKGKLKPSSYATCPQVVMYCNKCKEDVPGFFYVAPKPGGGRIRSQPGGDQPVVGAPLGGVRLRYTEMRQADGQTWYYVSAPGRGSGWIANSDVVCEPPPPPPPAPPDYSCKKDLKLPASLYILSQKKVIGVIHEEPSNSSPIIGSQPNGMRIVAKEVRESGGEPWYYVSIPGSKSGWVRGDDLVCRRPGDPVSPRKTIERFDPDYPYPTSAISSAGRG
jgi:hypothetical protein